MDGEPNARTKNTNIDQYKLRVGRGEGIGGVVLQAAFCQLHGCDKHLEVLEKQNYDL